jgi:hypothetical protein
LVCLEQPKANSTVAPKTKKQTSNTTSSAPKQANSAAQLSNINYSQAPSDLVIAIDTHEQSSHPSCVNTVNGKSQPINVYGKATDPVITLETKADAGFATYGNSGCDGPDELYVKVNGQWQFIHETKYGFSCNDLNKYGVPSDMFNPSECVSTDGSLIHYAHTLN